MKEIFEKYNIELSDNEIDKFKRFLEIFKEKNSQINLSAIREDEAIIEKHFIDSIILNVFLDFKEGCLTNSNDRIKVADLWTGWWFPWVPLAIINPDVDFILMDSVWKKLKAVEWFTEELDLNNVKTLNWRAEDIWQDMEYREKFDFVVSRAVSFLPTLLEYAVPLLKIWWIFVAYKLDDKEELKSAKKALSRLWAKILKVKNYRVWEQKRTLIFIEKKFQTHKNYPRKVWEPLKNPIK